MSYFNYALIADLIHSWFKFPVDVIYRRKCILLVNLCQLCYCQCFLATCAKLVSFVAGHCANCPICGLGQRTKMCCCGHFGQYLEIFNYINFSIAVNSLML